jgi:hypothetical protein
LICRSRGAVGDAQRLHFVEDGGVLGAGQCRRRSKAELVRALERERSYSRPMRERGLLREIGRCGLIVSGGVAEDKGNRRRGGPIVASQRQGGQRNRLSDVDAGEEDFDTEGFIPSSVGGGGFRSRSRRIVCVGLQPAGPAAGQN